MKIYWSHFLTLVGLCLYNLSFSQCTTTILDEPFNSATITGANAGVIYGSGGSNHNSNFILSGSYFGWFNIQNGIGPVDIYDRQVNGLSPGCTVDASIWIRESYGGTNVTISLIDDNNTTIATQTLNLTGTYQQITLSAPITTTGLRYVILFNGVGGNGLDIATEDLLITQTCLVTPVIGAQADQCLNGNSFDFDGTGSTADLPITSYTWDFGDTSPSANGSNVTHSYTSDGTYTVTLTASDGACTEQTTIMVTVHPNPIADAPADVSSCGDYILPALSDGAYFSSSGGLGPIAVGSTISSSQTIYVYAESGTIPNCTDENSFTVTINSEQYGTDMQTACGSLTWIDGNTYTSNNNTATHTIIGGATNGCDSIVTLDLTITNATNGIDTQSSCDPITWIDGNTYSTNNNTATHTIAGGAANGCDSIVTLDLTINSPSNGVDIQASCPPFVWIDGNSYTTDNNTATHTLVGGAANGCDSIITLNLTITPPSTGIDIQTSCPPFVWIDGNSYTTDNNTATHTILGGAANGCDSIVTLNLTILSAVSGTDIQIACDSYTWVDGNTYTSNNNSATFTILGGSAGGCDSIVTLDLTINQSYTETRDTTVCSGINYTFADSSFHVNMLDDQTYTSYLLRQNDCDSIVIENITVIPPDSISIGEDRSVCKDASVTLTAFSNNGIPIWSNGDSSSTLDVTILSDTFFVASISSICGSATDTIFITTHPPFTIDAGPDQTIPLGSSAALAGSGAIAYLWSPATMVDCDACPTTNTSNTETTNYILTGTDENGCTATDTVSVIIDGEINIYIPNIFSPNKDGENDLFQVYGVEWDHYHMEIYNRFGGVVFESEDANSHWNGKHHKNGNECQQGVYTYVFRGISSIGITYEKSGTVMLAR